MGSRNYTDQEIEIGLRTLAEYNGRPSVAAQALEKRGVKIPRQRLSAWKDQYSDRYAQIREEELPKIRARAADAHMQMAQRAAELAGSALDRLEEELPSLKGREVADALRNLSTVSGIHTDKAQALQGMPTAIVEHRTLKQLLRGLASKGVITLPESAVVEEKMELEEGKVEDAVESTVVEAPAKREKTAA
jgi:hypothetical protein